ncbi:MAG: hypothetical protein ACE14L_03180 [Terriglobales bacterium]
MRLLRHVHKDMFDMVWSMVTECGEQERHFNTLQSVYRGLASTWLLAMCAGIEFVLKERPAPDLLVRSNVDPIFFLITAISSAASVGVLLLWMLDTLVYHRLLLAVFHDGREIERACRWLPLMRNRMHSAGVKDMVRKGVSLFYTGITTIAGLIAVVSAYFTFPQSPRAQALLTPVFIAVVIVVWGVTLWKCCVSLKVPGEDETPDDHIDDPAIMPQPGSD